MDESMRNRLIQIDNECNEQIDRFGLIFNAAELVSNEVPSLNNLAKINLAEIFKKLVPLWDKQNGICPLSGIKIPFESIMDGKLYQIDHIIPHAEGGQTTFENAQLVCKDENRNKSDDFPTASL